jgi:1,4-dihydroxy-6-naphthoate synthase
MQYVALLSGAALGNGVGPLLIAKRALNMNQVEQYRIAIPGVNTTANFLLSYAFPEAANRVPVLFSEIESAVLNETVDLGVIIHENRFTYQQKGLVKICDLGELWEQRQGAAIPLGCIAARRTLPQDIVLKTESLIRKSLTHAFGQYPALSPYVRRHAQEMDEAVMRQHIELYVNNYTMDLGPQGKAAIEKLFAVYCQQNNLSVNSTPDLFLQNAME